jgi:hypothetical protein
VHRARERGKSELAIAVAHQTPLLLSLSSTCAAAVVESTGVIAQVLNTGAEQSLQQQRGVAHKCSVTSYHSLPAQHTAAAAATAAAARTRASSRWHTQGCRTHGALQLVRSQWCRAAVQSTGRGGSCRVCRFFNRAPPNRTVVESELPKHHLHALSGKQDCEGIDRGRSGATWLSA